ncbi:hypothetical protein V1517DRAFT_311601 [Lipomyces orientalis]|uniref:Uncharacterized protein n=1 Tax=Lipomyces orientalis TaxID=1233043 RepID=A0ACC3TYU4_9ASCO
MSKLPDLLRVFDGAHLPLSKTYPQLILVTSALSTSGSWILQHFVRASVANQQGSPYGSDSLEQKRPVVFVSFLHDLEFHARCFRKAGLDLNAIITAKQFIYVDGFTRLFVATPAETNSMVYLQSANKSTWLYQIRSAILEAKAGGISPTLIFEGLDSLHALGIMTAKEILRFVADLQEDSAISIISAYSVDRMLDGMSTLAQEQTAYLFSLARRAVAVFSLRPLSTGMAEDVTGAMRITNGGQPCDAREIVDENEFHYFLGDGNVGGVKVFEKGHW